MKVCKRCQVEQPHTEFGKNARYADRLWPYCKTCDKARTAAYRAANPEKVADTQARSLAKHREARNCRKRARRAANPEATQAERKVAYAKHRDRELATMQAWKLANRDHMRQQRSARYRADPDAARDRRNTYNRNNRGVARAWRMARIASKLKATPGWSDKAEIGMMYAVAVRVSACLGIPHEVDHVVPLQGAIGRQRAVSGLHVGYNLRVVAMPVNRIKSNTQWPDMPV